MAHRERLSAAAPPRTGARKLCAVGVCAVAATLLLVGPANAAVPDRAAVADAGARNSTVVNAPVGATIGGPELASTVVVVAAGVPPPPTSDAASYVVADVETGAVLAAKAPHEPQLPASTLKILTALTLLPELDPTEIVVGSDEAAAVEGSKAGIYPGLTYSIDLVFTAMLLQSGNDAAITLALAAGGIERTVTAMNDVAAELQAFDTVAVNTSGLDAPGQVTSAYDLALITRAALDREDFRAYITTEIADMPDRTGGTYQIQNENNFLADYDGAIGVKNGYTTLARHTFVGAAQRDGRTLVVTVLRTEGRPEPVVSALMDWGFANAASAEPVGHLAEPGDPLPVAEPAETGPPSGPGATGTSAAGAGEGGGGSDAQPVLVDAADAVDGDSSTSWLAIAATAALVLAAVVVALRARVLLRQRGRAARRPGSAR